MATQHYGKFRHVYGKAAKPDAQFLEIPSPLTSGEGPYVRASAKYFAFSGTSVRKLYVRSLTACGRFRTSEPHIGPDCLKGKIWDFDFHPCFDNILAMGDDAGKVALVTLPESLETDGILKENVSKATCDLGVVHAKKVVLLSFHPCANNVLATGSFDRSVKLSNVETQSELCTIAGFGDTIYSLDWNKNGSLIAVSSKDKNVRVCDPRVLCKDGSKDGMDLIIEKAFDGSKSTKLFWINGTGGSGEDVGMGIVGATGFSKTAKRMMKLWDLRKSDKALCSHTIDQASSILMPRFDSDNNILYLAGKGDGSIQFGEFRNSYSSYHTLSSYRSPDPQRGGGWVPKRGLNVWKCEIERFLKLTRKSIIPVSFIVPRKAGEDIFQSDIYPDAASGEASMTVDEWVGGANKELITMSLDPAQRENYNMTYRRSTLQQTRQISDNNSNGASPNKASSSSSSLSSKIVAEEKEQAQSPRIATLEQENQELKAKNSELVDKVKQLEARVKELEALQQAAQEEPEMPSEANAVDTAETADAPDENQEEAVKDPLSEA